MIRLERYSLITVAVLFVVLFLAVPALMAQEAAVPGMRLGCRSTQDRHAVIPPG